jgi:FAD/FMN-containing dehydrogenase
MSPVLGGGHGWLQGRYGNLADNLLSARLVLGNGTTITVSATENEDLWWGLRGAGHNFGIVASIEYKIYDRTPETDTWAYHEFIFSQDKLEDVYALANGLLRSPTYTPPPELSQYTYVLRIPDLDPNMVSIISIPPSRSRILPC